MKKGLEQAPDEPSAEETAAELARVKAQAQGFGTTIKGLDVLKIAEQNQEEKEMKTDLQSVLRNLSTDELIKRTVRTAMKDPETVGKVSKKLTEQTKRTPRKTAEQPPTQPQPSEKPPEPRAERTSPPKKNLPTLSKYAADSGEDTLTMARHVARVRRGKSVELSDYDRLMAGLPLTERVAEKTQVIPPPPPPVPQEKITIPTFEKSMAPAAPVVAEVTPPPVISEAASKVLESVNRLDNPAFAEWFSAQDSAKTGNPAEVEKFFSAFEIKEQVKNEVLKVWRERIAKESALQVAEADLALVANQLETLAKKEPEKFVAAYGETVKKFTEMPAEIARLEAQLKRVDTRTVAERRPELTTEEKKLKLAQASNRFLTGFGGGWGRLTGFMAWASGSETLKAQAEARKEVRKDKNYRTVFGGISGGGIFRSGDIEGRLSQIGEEYATAVGAHAENRAQVEIALARAKKGLQGARANVFADIGVKKEMSEFLSAKVAETVKQITTPGQITKLEDWMKADDWLTGLAARATDENKLADYLTGVPIKEVQTDIALGIRSALEVTTGEIIAHSLEHPDNPGKATELFSALDGAFGGLLTKKKMGVLEGDKVIEEVAAHLADEERKILREAGANARLKAAYIQSARARLCQKYRSPTIL